MNKQEKVISWLKTTEIPISKISKNTGITRQTLYKWINSDLKKLNHIHLKKVKLIYNTYRNYFNEGSDLNNMEQINQSLVMSLKNDRELIKLQKEKIENLEKKLKYSNKFKEKPAYHFKMVSKYVAKTDEWLDTDIFGDFSMTGFTYDEMVPLMNEENDKNSWLDRYHPDSRKRLNNKTLKNVRTDYHHLTWNHMMWMAKDGQYKCYNIDLVYIRAEEKVTCMFYWVNGDAE